MNTRSIVLKQRATRKKLQVLIAASLLLLITTVLMTEPASAGKLSGSEGVPTARENGANFSGKVHAFVPFAFSVRGKSLEAGDYYVSRVGEKIVSISDVSGKNTVLAFTEEVDLLGGHSSPKLVFRHYGDKYFLAEAWLSYTGIGREFPASNEERKLAKDERREMTTIDLGK